MRISDWSSDVCSSDLGPPRPAASTLPAAQKSAAEHWSDRAPALIFLLRRTASRMPGFALRVRRLSAASSGRGPTIGTEAGAGLWAKRTDRTAGCGAKRSEEHTSELQSLRRTSYAVFCLSKTPTTNPRHKHILHIPTTQIDTSQSPPRNSA